MGTAAPLNTNGVVGPVTRSAGSPLAATPKHPKADTAELQVARRLVHGDVLIDAIVLIEGGVRGASHGEQTGATKEAEA